MLKWAAKAALYLTKDEKGRKVLIGFVVGFFVMLILPVLITVYILTTSITNLTSLITDADMLKVILDFKSEYSYLIHKGGGLYGWPIPEEYEVDKSDETNLFGWRIHPIYGDNRLHTGVDIQAPNGTECYAIGAGTVIATGDSGGWGYIVQLDLGKNSAGQTLTCKYCHLTAGSIKVKVGDTVTRGQLLALTGTTGQTQGGHIHFEMMEDGVYCDPLNYIGVGGDYGDLDLFYRCVEAEAGNQPHKGKVAVAQCMIYTSDRKGISLDEVIKAPGQYSCYSNGSIFEVTPSADTIAAADEALSGELALEYGTEYYINYKIAEVTWWHKTLIHTGTIGDHTFYKSP